VPVDYVMMVLHRAYTACRQYGRSRWLRKVSWTNTENRRMRLQKIGRKVTLITGL